MTLKNVAVISGCSVSTVSKVFSNSAEISDDTKQKVLQAATETGYFEKASKRKPVLGTIKTVVLLSTSVTDELTSLFEGLSKTAKKSGYLLLAAIGSETEANLIVNQMGALGAIILSTKPKKDDKIIKYLATSPSGETAETALKNLIREIDNAKPVRVRTKKADTENPAAPAEPNVKPIDKAKKEEIWLL